MKILIIADMEGISGVGFYGQTWDKNLDYDNFRNLMTKEVNVAIEGAFLGGATEVNVCDFHRNGVNILLNELDSRASLYSGQITLAQIKNRIIDIDAICFIGFHGGAGEKQSILEHTMNFNIHKLSINGIKFDEMALETILASEKNIPTIFVSGDNTACEYAQKTFKNVKTTITKYSLGRESGKMLPIKKVHEDIKRQIESAVKDLKKDKNNFSSINIKFPANLEIEFINGGLADIAEMMPNTKRINGHTISYEAKNYEELYRAYYTLQYLGSPQE